MVGVSGLLVADRKRSATFTKLYDGKQSASGLLVADRTRLICKGNIMRLRVKPAMTKWFTPAMTGGYHVTADLIRSLTNEKSHVSPPQSLPLHKRGSLWT